MPASYDVAILTQRPGPHVLPAIHVTVDAVDIDRIPVGGRFDHNDIIATAVTDESGVAEFRQIDGTRHWFRARMAETHIVEILSSTQISPGDECWDAIVKPDGSGTDATLQAAIDRIGVTGGKILICGMLDEAAIVPSSQLDMLITGRHSSKDGIRPSTAGRTALSIGGLSQRIRIEHLTLGGAVGAGTPRGIQLNSPSAGALVDINVAHCVFEGLGAGALTEGLSTNGLVACSGMCSIIDCRFNTSSIGIEIAPTGGILLIDHCHITAGAGVGIDTTASGVHGASICNNRISASGIAAIRIRAFNEGSVSGNFLLCQGAATHGIEAGTSIAESTIVNNLIERSTAPTTGDAINFDNALVRQVSVANNQIQDSHRYGIYVHAPVLRLAVVGNVIEDTTSDGMFFEQILNNEMQSITIVGNVIYSAGDCGIKFAGNNNNDADANRLRDVAICGNVIYDPVNDGVHWVAYAFGYHDFAVTGNVVVDPGGVGFNDAGNNVIHVTIIGNVCRTAAMLNNLADNATTIISDPLVHLHNAI